MPTIWPATIQGARTVAIYALTISVVSALAVIVLQAQIRWAPQIERLRSRLGNPYPWVEQWLEWLKRNDIRREARNAFAVALGLSVLVALICAVIYHQ
jgi:hypothetical protein